MLTPAEEKLFLARLVESFERIAVAQERIATAAEGSLALDQELNLVVDEPEVGKAPDIIPIYTPLPMDMEETPMTTLPETPKLTIIPFPVQPRREYARGPQTSDMPDAPDVQ